MIMMTVEILIAGLKSKETFSAFDNQVAKLHRNEMELFVKLNNIGIVGEDALSFVFTASTLKMI